MFVYEKKLQYPIKVKNPNPKLASYIISQYGGPDGELGASLRYLSQRFTMPYDELKGLLTDIGTRSWVILRWSAPLYTSSPGISATRMLKTAASAHTLPITQPAFTRRRIRISVDRGVNSRKG
jgi:spore coat protein JC